MTTDETIWLEGHISIEAVLESGSRPLEAIYIRKGKWDRRLARMKKKATSAEISIHIVDDQFIADRTNGKSHGGVIAAVGPRRTVSLDALVANNPTPFIAMLDGIEDPFNFGQAVRTLYASGVDGIVVRPRNWTSAASVVARASAGASERVALAVADSAEIAADTLQAHGLVVACMAKEESVPLMDADLTQPMFVLIGGERRGITRSFLSRADLRLQIPYGRPDFRQSLGAAASAAILGFELLRQRRTAGGRK